MDKIKYLTKRNTAIINNRSIEETEEAVKYDPLLRAEARRAERAKLKEVKTLNVEPVVEVVAEPVKPKRKPAKKTKITE